MRRMAVSENPPAAPGTLPYIWLVYLGALFFQPAFDPTARLLDWLAVGVLIAVFLPLYSGRGPAPRPAPADDAVGAMRLLAVVGSLVNTGASIFVVYAARLPAT